MQLAANHPQNPYGVPVRVRYQAFDVGASTRTANNEFNRIVLGIKGFNRQHQIGDAVGLEAKAPAAQKVLNARMLHPGDLPAGIEQGLQRCCRDRVVGLRAHAVASSAMR